MHFSADEDILNSVHRFRPKFLATADGLPLYYEPYEFQHTCLLTCQKNGNTDTMAADDEHSELPNEKRKCNSVPFVPSSYFLSHEVAENLATIIKEVLQFFCHVKTILDIELILFTQKRYGIDLSTCSSCSIGKSSMYRTHIWQRI